MIAGYYFTPLTAVLFTFPSRYLFTIGRQGVFSLRPWSVSLHAKFHVHRVTQGTTRLVSVFEYRPLTFFGATFHPLPLTFTITMSWPYNPKVQALWFGLFRFRSPLLTESILFLFLRLLRCFTSPGVALPVLCIHTGVIRYYSHRITPFGNPRITACLPLPEAYRSFPRPSSPLGAKAFIIRSL